MAAKNPPQTQTHRKQQFTPQNILSSHNLVRTSSSSQIKRIHPNQDLVIFGEESIQSKGDTLNQYGNTQTTYKLPLTTNVMDSQKKSHSLQKSYRQMLIQNAHFNNGFSLADNIDLNKFPTKNEKSKKFNSTMGQKNNHLNKSSTPQLPSLDERKISKQ